MEKMLVYILTKKDSDCKFIVNENGLDSFMAEIQTSYLGDEFTIKIAEMDVEEYENLPEFEGF